MIKRKICTKICISFFLIFVTTISISSSAFAKTYIGAGGTTCGEYISSKKSLPGVAQAIEFWILGYVSGLNFITYATREVDLLSNQSSNEIIGFVQGYCSTNTEKSLNNAANEYWVQLSKKYAQ